MVRARGFTVAAVINVDGARSEPVPERIQILFTFKITHQLALQFAEKIHNDLVCQVQLRYHHKSRIGKRIPTKRLGRATIQV
jgi:hypothetical protein